MTGRHIALREPRWTWRLGRVIVALAIVAFVTGQTGEPSVATSSTWACTWIDGPHLSKDKGRCTGAVHCRLSKAYSFIPMVRKVDCPAASGTCNAAVCLEWVLMLERAGRVE